HLLGRPGLQDRVSPVAERGRWPAGFVSTQRGAGLLLDRPAEAGGRVEPTGAVACDSAVYRQRSPGKTARRQVGDLAGRLGERSAAGASRKGGAGKDSSEPRAACARAADGFQIEK